jgi:phage major head subunit gpT-like protein
VKRWANAISVKIDDLEDDDMNLGQYRPLIAEMADDFVEHRHQLFIDLLVNGFSLSLGTAYDGQAFFDSDHPVAGGGTQSNTSVLEFDAANLRTALSQLNAMKKPNGNRANVRATHGIFPLALQAQVEEVLMADFYESGGVLQSNTLKNRIIPIFDPRLDDTSETAWFLIDASKALKPFFWVNRKPVTPQVDTTDEFEEGMTHWGAYARYNASYGFYQTVWGSTGEGA